jgi:hypothetical protein
VKTTKHTYLIILFTIMCFAFTKQEKDKPHTIKTKLDYVTVDNLGNVYVINGDELVKYSPTTKFFARYSNLKLGAISSVDATNPLKLVVYYRDFQQILFLDNQLSINSEQVSLEKLGHEQTELVCASANNSFWIYDKQNNELLRYNENSKKIANTGNLKQVLQTDIAPNFITECNGFLYLNCPENGIYVFDIFGAFSKLIALRDLKQFQVSENLIYYKKDSSFCSYDYKLFEETCKNFLGSATTLEMKYNNHRLYKAYKDSVVWINLAN